MKKVFTITILILLAEISNGQLSALLNDDIKKEIARLDSSGDNDGQFWFEPPKKFLFMLNYSGGSLTEIRIDDNPVTASAVQWYL